MGRPNLVLEWLFNISQSNLAMNKYSPGEHHVLLKEMQNQLSKGNVDVAYGALTRAQGNLEQLSIPDRDFVAKWFLNFCEIFLSNEDYPSALAAAKIGEQCSTLHADLSNEMVDVIENKIRTKQEIAKLRSRGKIAKKDQDVDEYARLASEELKLVALERNNRNPLWVKRWSYLDYPEDIHLETLAVCNAACTFCPYPTIDRQGERMDDELIEKIIDDLQEIPPDVRFNIKPYKVSDPFIEKRLIAIIIRINEKLPNATLLLISNVTRMAAKSTNCLRKSKNVDSLRISLNAHLTDKNKE